MTLTDRLQPNPIIIKELRSRMRGPRAFIILTIMLLFLAGALYGTYRLNMLSAGFSPMPGPIIGQSLFQTLITLQLIVICLITPALTAGAISSEREQLTYEMLLTTPLSPARILWGKLVSALSYILLLLFAAIPIAGLVFIFGGVTPWQMLRGFVALFVVAILFGTLGIFMSAWLGRTGRATVLSYIFVVLIFVLPVVAIIVEGTLNEFQEIPSRELLMLNPASFVYSAILSAKPSPMMFNGVSFGGLGFVIAGNFDIFDGNFDNLPRPLYHYSLPLYAGMTILFYLLATQLVKPSRRWRIDWRAGLITIILLAILGGLIGYGFWATHDQYDSPRRTRERPDVRVIEDAVPEAPAIIAEPTSE